MNDNTEDEDPQLVIDKEELLEHIKSADFEENSKTSEFFEATNSILKSLLKILNFVLPAALIILLVFILVVPFLLLFYLFALPFVGVLAISDYLKKRKERI